MSKLLLQQLVISDLKKKETEFKRAAKIDISFNNISILGKESKPSDRILDGHARLIGINLNGMFFCMNYEIEVTLKQGGGVIIKTACILGSAAFSTVRGM